MQEAINKDTKQIVQRAYKLGKTVPAFNVPYLPMIAPIIQALKDTNTFGLIQVARLEWMKFQSRSLEAVAEEYHKHGSFQHTRLHLDHVPVIDEDGKRPDFLEILKRALNAGYESLMVDGSRLPLEENIKASSEAARIARHAQVPLEAELGAVMGHEAGPLPPYEELFKSGKGFTDVEQAKRFVNESNVDWLSVAIGNIHGAISDVLRDRKKVAARLDIVRLRELNQVLGIPLVLHGGSGIQTRYIREAIKNGIAKINIGTNIRQPYERTLETAGKIEKAQDSVYKAVKDIIVNEISEIQLPSHFSEMKR